MAARLPAESLLLDGLDCLHLAGPLARYLREQARRDGGVPPRLAALAEEVAAVADRYRERAPAGSDLGTGRFRPGAPGAPCVTSATWLTVGQTAQVLKVSPGYVRRLCRQRALTSARAAGRGAWRVDEASVAQWLDEHREEAA